MSDAGPSSADERSEFTLPEWWCALTIVGAFGAGFALLASGMILHSDLTATIGAALIALPFPLSWFEAAIEIRAGRAEPCEVWSRGRWKWKLLRAPISGVIAATAWWLFGCSGGAFAGLALGILFALADPTAHAVAILAHRFLDPPSRGTPSPTTRIEGPKRVFGWLAATIAATAAGLALLAVGGTTSRPPFAVACAALLGLALVTNWRRKCAIAEHGAPRRYSR